MHRILFCVLVLTAACESNPRPSGIHGGTAPTAPAATGPAAAAAADPAADPAAAGAADPAAAAAPSAGPPAIRRMIPGQEAATAGPYHRGDYLIILDWRAADEGTYGFLSNGDDRWWIVEADEVVGGPHLDGGPEMTQVIAAWTVATKQRHQNIMNGIAARPNGCLDGCRFDVYRNGQYAGTRIEY